MKVGGMADNLVASLVFAKAVLSAGNSVELKASLMVVLKAGCWADEKASYLAENLVEPMVAEKAGKKAA